MWSIALGNVCVTYVPNFVDVTLVDVIEGPGTTLDRMSYLMFGDATTSTFSSYFDPSWNPSGKPGFTSPYEDPAGQGYIISGGHPFYLNGVYYSVLTCFLVFTWTATIGMDISIQNQADFFQQQKVTPRSTWSVLDNKGNIILTETGT